MCMHIIYIYVLPTSANGGQTTIVSAFNSNKVIDAAIHASLFVYTKIHHVTDVAIPTSDWRQGPRDSGRPSKARVDTGGS